MTKMESCLFICCCLFTLQTPDFIPQRGRKACWYLNEWSLYEECESGMTRVIQSRPNEIVTHNYFIKS